MDADKKKPVEIDDSFLQIPRVYANAVKVSHSLYDFQLIVGQAVNTLDDQPVQIVEPKYITYMSPPHFKVLTKLFNEQLAAYEKKHGPIPYPPAAKKTRK